MRGLRLEFADLVAGKHLLLSDPVAEPGMDHRADDREPIGNGRLLGEQFAEPQARRLRGDRLEWPPVFQRRIRLGIPSFQMAGPAVQKDHDHRLGLAGSGRGSGRFRPQAIQLREAQWREA